MTKLAAQFMLERLQRQELRLRLRLGEQMLSLAERMKLKAEQLQRGAPREAIINSLGEVQLSGTNIDVLCARYDAVLTTYLELKALMDDDAVSTGHAPVVGE